MAKKTETKTVVAAEKSETATSIPWTPWAGLVFVVLVFFGSEYFGSFLVSLYPFVKGWSLAVATTWLNNSVFAQFIYILLAETFTVGAIYLFLRFYKKGFSAIGLHRPHWRDPLFGLLAVPIYLLVLIIAVGIISAIVPGFNPNQQQQIGFDHVHGALPLILTAISLVILPPIAEEIMVRGFLYTTLKKWMPRLAAVLLTSALFASAHLPEGGSAGPLWIGALDTFILSLFLIYLREKTHNLWASITLHALKNGIAYYSLYLSPLVHFHL